MVSRANPDCTQACELFESLSSSNATFATEVFPSWVSENDPEQEELVFGEVYFSLVDHLQAYRQRKMEPKN